MKIDALKDFYLNNHSKITLPVMVYGSCISDINEQLDITLTQFPVTEIMSKNLEKIDEIKDVIQFVYMTPIYYQYKFVLLKNAQKWTKNVLAALLKTLEEYPVHSKIIITSTSKLDMVLMSRCYKLHIECNELFNSDVHLSDISDNPDALFNWTKFYMNNLIESKNLILVDYADKLWRKINDTYSWYRKGEESLQTVTQIMYNLIKNHLETCKAQT